MKLISLRLRGIGRFTKEVELPVDKLGPDDRLVAVIGTNGSGKSTVMGLLHGSWWGHIPGYGTLAAMATDRNSMVEQVIEMGGVELISKVAINATANPVKQQAYLSVDGVPRNKNGKIGEYKNLVNELLPSAELHLASAFAAQGGGGRFLDLSRADRRKLFASMLGLNHIKELGDVAGLRLKAVTLESVKLLASVDALKQVADLSLCELAALLHHAKIGVVVKATDRCTIEIEQEEIAKATAAWEDRRKQVARDSAAITDQCDSALRNISDVKTRADQLDKEMAAINTNKSVLRSTQHDMKAVQSTIDEGKNIDDDLATANQRLDLAVVAHEQALAQHQEWNCARAKIDIDTEMEQHVIDSVIRLVHLNYSANTTKLAAAKEGAGLIDRVACESGTAMQAMCPLLANAIVHKESIDCLEFKIKTMRRSLADENKKLELLASKKEAALLDLGPEPVIDIYTASTPRQAVKHLTAKKIRIDHAIAQRGVYRERAMQLGRSTSKEKEVAAECAAIAEKLHILNAEYIVMTIRKKDLFAAMDCVIDDRPIENSAEDLALARREETAAQATVAVLEARIAKAEKDQGAIANLEINRERVLTEIDDWTELCRVLGPEGVQALLIDAAGPEVGDLANALLSSCYGDRFAVQFTTTRAKADGKGTQEVFDLLVTDNERGREARAEGFSVGEKTLINEALSLAIAIYNGRKSGIEMSDLVRDECSGALHVNIAPLYVTMLRKALDVGGFNRCFFVTHQQELVDLADAVFDFHDGIID